MFEAVEIFPLNIAPSLSSQPSFEDWYNMVIDQHQNSTTLDLREWDNCFGNMYAGCTSTYPKFWSYITQVIHTEIQVFKVNVCLSVALINTTNKVEIDYIFENNNSAYILVNNEDIGKALSLTEDEKNAILAHVRKTIPELAGIKEALERYMNQNNYSERWTENANFLAY